MGAVKIRGTFKKDERDQIGLGAISQQLIDEPLTRHYVVALVETESYEVDVRDGGTKTPKVRFVALEPVEGEDALDARKILERAYAERTGQASPPPTLFDEERPAGDEESPDDPEPDHTIRQGRRAK